MINTLVFWRVRSHAPKIQRSSAVMIRMALSEWEARQSTAADHLRPGTAVYIRKMTPLKMDITQTWSVLMKYYT